MWVVDAHPEDINKVDFVAADGTPNKATHRRRAPEERRARSTPASARAPRTSTRTRPTACTSTSSTSAPTRRASCTTRSASARSTAPARRRAAWRSPSPQLGNAEGYTTCTFNLKNTGAAAAVPAGTHPQDASAYLNSDVYRLSASATGTGYARVPQERVRDRQVRRVGLGPGLHREGHRLRHGHAQRGLRERSDQDRLARSARWPTHGRRLRPGHAGADHGRAGVASARSRRAWARTTSPPPRRTSSPPPVTRP